MGAAFGAGICFSLVSGVPNPVQSAFTTGVAFAGFNGLFYQVRSSATVFQWSVDPAAAAAVQCVFAAVHMDAA